MPDDEKQRKLQVLLELYKEQCSHGRHTEMQRQSVASMFLTLNVALMSVIGAMQFAPSSALLAISIVALGLYAKKFIAVYEKKWDELSSRRSHYRLAMQSLTGIESIKEPPKPEQRQRLRRYWRMTFSTVSVIGVALLVIVLVLWHDGKADISTLKRCSEIRRDMLSQAPRINSGPDIYRTLNCSGQDW